MSKLTDKQKDSFDESVFGVPELRKYPLNDREHVLKAIQFFHHCPIEYKKELAHNINRAAKKYDITISKESNIYEYLNESDQMEIDFFEDIHLLEAALYINEAFTMSEPEAKGAVDVAIKLWRKRKSFVKNDKDKSKLLIDIKTENVMLRNLQSRNDFNGILLRAKTTATTLNKKLATDSYEKAKKARNASGLRNPTNSRLGTMVGVGLGAAAAGAAIGAAKGKMSANYKGNGSAVTKLKVGGGAAIGALAGNAIGVAGMAAVAGKQSQDKQKAQDPEKPLRQHAERYANFMANFQSEVLSLQPGVSQQQEEGED